MPEIPALEDLLINELDIYTKNWSLPFNCIDSNSILVNLKLKKEINKLIDRKEVLERQIEIDKKIISNLKNPDSLEKYAREKLYMKKDNEEIYIIEFKE